MSESKQKVIKPKFCCPNCHEVLLATVQVKLLDSGYIDGKLKERNKDNGLEVYYRSPSETKVVLDQFYRFFCSACHIFFQDPIPIPVEE